MTVRLMVSASPEQKADQPTARGSEAASSSLATLFISYAMHVPTDLPHR